MKLDDATLSTLREYAKHLKHSVTFQVYGGMHPKRAELISMLEQVASVSDLLSVEHSQTDAVVREGLTFELLAQGEKTGVLFSGIPGGHEFNSFVLAYLQAGGHTIKLDEGIKRQVAAIHKPVSFESIISLDCHVCPDVVQILNQFALLNPLIRHEMIDGTLHPKLVEERRVQGVPAVFRDKKVFANGKISAADVLEKLSDVIDPQRAQADSAEAELYDVAIVGGGPAAVAAAVYTARKGLSVVMLAERIGGQLNDTQGIENFISVEKTTGAELTHHLRAHLGAYPIKQREEVRVKTLNVQGENAPKKLLLSTGETLLAHTVIIATGARWRELGVPGERENIGQGVAYCPHCDGPFFKGKDITVVGGGNSGVEAALDLAGIAKSVTVLEFLDTLKADQVLVEKMNATDNINVMTGVATEEIVSDGKQVTGMRLLKRADETKIEHRTEGVFVQIGLVPNSAFVKGVLDLTQYGEIIVNDRCQTSVQGVYACGDVTNVPYKQIIIAMGEGAKAGLAAFEHILKSVAR